MAQIPSSINGVVIELASTVGNNVDQVLINGLNFIVKQDIASGYTLNKIYISSARDSHSPPSRHCSGKACDISRINGKKMGIYYNSDSEVTEITKALQNEFENFSQRRENFGPYMKKKLGNNFQISGHDDHIHISVN